MTVYRVLPDCKVTWPDGTTRAEAGQCFEGYDSQGCAAARDLCSGILADQLDQFVVEDGTPTDVQRDLPPEIADALLFFNGALPVAPAKAKAKPKKKASVKATRLADPED